MPRRSPETPAKPRRRRTTTAVVTHASPGIPPTQGRWPKIADPAIADGIILGLQAGLPLAPAAARLRIPERTVQRWHARGLASINACSIADEDGLPIPDPDEPYHTFALRVTEARGAAEAAAVAVIAKAIRLDDVDTSKWYLERVAPQRWGNPARVDLRVSGDPDAPLTVTAIPPPADLFTVEQRLTDVLAALDEASVPAASRLRRIIETTATVAE